MLKNSTRRHDSVTTRKAFWTFCLLLAVFFLPFVIRGHPPLSRAFFTDAVVQFYPWLKLAEAQLWRGEPPLWNPFNFCGSPLLANGQAAVFYPLNFLLYLLPDTPALILIAAAKLFIGGTFMWAFLRRQKLPPNASFLGAIVFVFSGYMLGWLRFPITNVYSLLPAAMFFTHKLVFENSAGAWAGLSLTVGSIILGGQPQALVAAALLTLPYGFLFWVRSPEKISGVKLLGAYAAGLSIGAVQLLPFLEYLDWSAASKVRSLFNFFWYPASQHLITYLLPGFFGQSGGDFNWGVTNSLELCVYIGVVPLLAACFAGKHPARPQVLFFAILFGLFACILYRIPSFSIVSYLVDHSPLRPMGLHKLLGPMSFCLTVLSAFGFDVLLNGRSRFRYSPVAVALVFMTIAGSYLYFFRNFIDSFDLWTWELFQIGLLFLFLAPATLLLCLRRLSANTVVPLLTLVIVADLWTCSALTWKATQSLEALYPKTEFLDLVEREPRPFRVHDMTGFLTGSVAPIYGLEDIQGYDAMTPRHYLEYIFRVNPDLDRPNRELISKLLSSGKGGESAIDEMTLLRRHFLDLYRYYGNDLIELLATATYAYPSVHPIKNRKLYDAMNVEFLIARNPIDDANLLRLAENSPVVYRNRSVLPRTFIVSEAAYVTSDREALEAITAKDFNFREKVVLQTQDEEENRFLRRPPEKAEARVLEYGANRIILETFTPQSGFVVLLDAYYPGWKATVDQTPAPVHRANYLFRAVRLPQGRHIVKLTMESETYHQGKWLSILGLASMLTATLVSLRNKVRHNSGL